MKYTFILSEFVREEIKALPIGDVNRIVKKLRYFASQSNPMAYAKPLTGKFAGLFRFRIGDYRAIFRKDSDGELIILYVLKIHHRKDIYE